MRRSVDIFFSPDELLRKCVHVDSTREFCQRTGLYHNIDYCSLLDIKPDSLIGDFECYRFDELLDYCKKNPDLHIVSNIGPGVLINRAWPGAVSYHLADRDKNPLLYHRC